MQNFSHDIELVQNIKIVPNILDIICKTTGMGFAAVARVTEERWIACNVRDDIGFGLKPGGELKVETTICNEIRENRQPVVINHVVEDKIYAGHPTPAMYKFQSYISIPIILPDGKFFGTLCAIDPNPAKSNLHDVLETFKMFADLIAFHIDTSERLLKSESTLGIERESSELREQFIAVLGHDLRNPLGAISSGASLLKRMGQKDRRGLEIVDMIQDSVIRMSSLIENMLDFARGRLGGGITLHRDADEPVKHILVQIISEAKATWPDRVIEKHFDLAENVNCDHRRVGQLFSNLLSNAMSYGKPDQPIKINAISKNGKFELSVSNAADPIPPEILKRLFHPFSRGDSTKYKHGLGLGLYISHQIATAHGGDLTVISNDKETKFTFSM